MARQRRVLHELGDERAAHRVADQDQALGAVGERVARGRLEVAPLGQAHVVEPVRAGRRAEVLAVGDQQRGQAGPAQLRKHAQPHLGSSLIPWTTIAQVFDLAPTLQAGIFPSSPGTSTSANGIPSACLGSPLQTFESIATFVPGTR